MMMHGASIRHAYHTGGAMSARRAHTKGVCWWWGDTAQYNAQERGRDQEVFAQDDAGADSEDSWEDHEDEEDEEPPCPDHIKRFAMSRVDWKSSPHALKPNQPVDHLYWPNFIVEEPNGTFFTGPYAHRPCIVFWAPAIFWPRYGKRPRVHAWFLPIHLFCLGMQVCVSSPMSLLQVQPSSNPRRLER